jgi:hypothetical protein
VPAAPAVCDALAPASGTGPLPWWGLALTGVWTGSGVVGVPGVGVALPTGVDVGKKTPSVASSGTAVWSASGKAVLLIGVIGT